MTHRVRELDCRPHHRQSADMSRPRQTFSKSHAFHSDLTIGGFRQETNPREWICREREDREALRYLSLECGSCPTASWSRRDTCRLGKQRPSLPDLPEHWP